MFYEFTVDLLDKEVKKVLSKFESPHLYQVSKDRFMCGLCVCNICCKKVNNVKLNWRAFIIFKKKL